MARKKSPAKANHSPSPSLGEVEPGVESMNIKVDLYEYEPNDEIKQKVEELKE